MKKDCIIYPVKWETKVSYVPDYSATINEYYPIDKIENHLYNYKRKNKYIRHVLDPIDATVEIDEENMNFTFVQNDMEFTAYCHTNQFSENKDVTLCLTPRTTFCAEVHILEDKKLCDTLKTLLENYD